MDVYGRPFRQIKIKSKIKGEDDLQIYSVENKVRTKLREDDRVISIFKAFLSGNQAIKLFEGILSGEICLTTEEVKKYYARCRVRNLSDYDIEAII